MFISSVGAWVAGARSRLRIGLGCVSLGLLAWGCGDGATDLHVLSPSLDRARFLSGRANLLEVSVPRFLDGRRCFVYLPPGYHDKPYRRYPVLYVLDGQYLMNEIGAHRAADSLIGLGRLEPLIMVGIATGPMRVYEYSPWADSWYHELGGGGDVFLRAIVEDLKPVIDAHFLTRPDRSNTYIAGHSIAGLMAVYAAFAATTFGRVAAFSPAYWWSNDTISIYSFVESRGRSGVERLYQDTGARFDQSPYDLYLMRDIAVSLGFRDSVDIMTYIDPDGVHNVPSWARHVPGALQFLRNERAAAATLLASAATRGAERRVVKPLRPESPPAP